jgi:hypothetical protein
MIGLASRISNNRADEVAITENAATNRKHIFKGACGVVATFGVDLVAKIVASLAVELL